MPCRSRPTSRSARAACSRPSATACWCRCCSRCGRWGGPSRCAPPCCSATRWRPSACCRDGASSRSRWAPACCWRRWRSSRPRHACSRSTTAWACVGVFAVFVGLGSAIAWAARRVPRPRRPELALAIRNLGAPGGLTRSVVLSLGTGLSLLVTVALVDASIINELTSRLPEESPNYFVLDIKPAESDAFRALVAREAPEAKVAEAPMLRGRVDQAGRPPGRAGQGGAGGAMGAQRRPRPHLLANRAGGLDGGRGQVVAGRLRRRAAGLLRGRDRQGAAPEDRRYRHGQHPRPQRHGAHRQPARGEVGEPFPQLRHGVLAQHAGRRAGTTCWRRSRCRRASPWPSRPSWRSRSAAPFRRPPPSA